MVPRHSIRFSIGDGSLIHFWKYSWLGDVPLCSHFNRIFHLDRDKNCLVKDRFATGAWSWNWFRPINGGRALADLNSLLIELGSVTLSNKVDLVSSSLSSDGSYSVSDVRKHIDDCFLLNPLPCTRWCKVIPQKVNIFMWRLFLDSLPHRLNLSLRGLDINSIMRLMCNNHVESNAHVFFSCDIARDVWSLVLGWCDSKFPLLSFCDDWDVWYPSWNASKDLKTQSSVIFSSSCWVLWRFRNNVTFHSQVMRKCDIFDKIRLFSFLWLKSRGATNGSGDIKDALYSWINPGVVYKAHNRKSASLKDDFIKSAMGAMDRTLSSFNEESSEGKIENEVEAGFRRRGTGQNISAKSFSSLECLWEGSALPEASLLFYRATPTYLRLLGFVNALSISDEPAAAATSMTK
ncbi:RNA-directed DNA polymerase, eukaryota [Tanacetum coccineum]